MVFWMTFQQIKLFDFFRPGDIKSLKNVSASHSFQETFISHLSIDELIAYLDDKMNHRSFRFMKISSQKNTHTNETKGNVVQQEMEARGGKTPILSDFRETYSIKLYKLSDIFQYLSVIELTLEDCEFNKNNNKKENGKRNNNLDILLSASKKFDGETDDRINSNKKEIKTRLFLNSVSVNIFPAFFPLGFLFGFLFLLVPFSDFGVNRKYINELTAILNLNSVTVKHETTEESVSSTIRTEKVETENVLLNKVDEEIYVPPSTIFFFSFIICPVLLAAFFLLFF
jgi:hypothetical protein